MDLITHDRLLELLDYNPNTGIFAWKKMTVNHIKEGTRAGHIGTEYGYRIIRVDGRLYRCGRLAWFYMTKRWPEPTVDHINRDRLDDRFCNLREATYFMQTNNRIELNCKNTSGVHGVSLTSKTKKWRARILVDGREIRLGRFNTFEEAVAARKEAERRYRKKNQYKALDPWI